MLEVLRRRVGAKTERGVFSTSYETLLGSDHLKRISANYLVLVHLSYCFILHGISVRHLHLLRLIVVLNIGSILDDEGVHGRLRVGLEDGHLV